MSVEEIVWRFAAGFGPLFAYAGIMLWLGRKLVIEAREQQGE